MAKITPYKITLELPDSTKKTELTDHLMHDLSMLNEQAFNSEFILLVRNESNQLLGGLNAITSYGWLQIKVLWVRKAERRCKLGSQLMNTATNRAKEIGCHGVWLDTSSPEAYAFYSTLGFKTFGTLINKPHQHPATHKRWMMRKEIK